MADRTAGVKPDHNVYTVLLIVAAAYVIAATLYLAVRNQQMFGSWNPFSGA